MAKNGNQDKGALLTVKTHPASSRPGIAGLVCFGVVFFAWSISKFFGSSAWGLAGGLLLFFSLSNFFFPTIYTFRDNDLKIKNFWGSRIYKYERFRTIRQMKNGIFLSPYVVPTRFDSLRGVFLLMDKDQVQETVKIIKEKLATIPGKVSPDA